MTPNGNYEKAQNRARDQWTESRGVRLHYLDTGVGDSSLLPVVFIPGALGGAELYLREIQSLEPRRCIAISLRGRGKSEAPTKGYTLEDHVSDIESIIRNSELNNYCLVAYSMGVPYAIEHAARDQGRVKGLVIGDYAARLPLVKPEWVEQNITRPGVKPNAVIGLHRESKEIMLWDRLEVIRSPVLVVRGGKPGSLLSEENAERYRSHLSDVIVVRYEDSDHDISKPSYERYLDTIKDFLERLDRRHSPSSIV